MLRSLKLTNFTAFAEANLRFSAGLNVFVGENGVGKTHLLKLPYAVMALSAEEGRRNSGGPTKALLQRRIADKLVSVMRPESLGRLARRKRGRQRCEVDARFAAPPQRIAFHFATQSKSEVVVETAPSTWLEQAPVFLPTRELLSIYPGFSALYDSRHLEFEETWRDTCQLLGSPTIKGPREANARELLTPLEDLMDGRLLLDRNGRFYLHSPTGTMEMPLVAEGVRKLGMLARLIATGALASGGCLFWDEPETNLNPKLMRGVAEAILQVCAQGMQVFVATHSLFLLREFEVLLGRGAYADAARRYFALSPPRTHSSDTSDGVTVMQGEQLEDVDPLTLLDEDLEHADREAEAGAGLPWSRRRCREPSAGHPHRGRLPSSTSATRWRLATCFASSKA